MNDYEYSTNPPDILEESGYETRYSCDYWCDECEDFIRTDEPVFKVYEDKKHKTLCLKHYKEYLKREEIRDKEYVRKQLKAVEKYYLKRRK